MMAVSHDKGTPQPLTRRSVKSSAMVESSLPQLLSERARLEPDDTAFTYIDYEQDSEGVSESLTWSGLYRRTSNVARELRSCGATGDRAVILAPQGTEYLVAFLGALQAGQIAVPLPLPLPGSGDERVRSVLLDASPSAILTTSAVVSDIVPYVGPTPTGDTVSILEVDLLDLDSDPGPAEADNVPFSVAHLQYTSGSTRTPAGVMVSHQNIRVNCEQIMSRGSRTESLRRTPPWCRGCRSFTTWDWF